MSYVAVSPRLAVLTLALLGACADGRADGTADSTEAPDGARSAAEPPRTPSSGAPGGPMHSFTPPSLPPLPTAPDAERAPDPRNAIEPSPIEPSPAEPSSAEVGDATAPVLVGGLQRLHASLRYPETARHAGRQGRVVVRVVVSPAGTVTSATVLHGITAALDAEALRAVRAARYEPATIDRRPVEGVLSIPVTFTLSDA